MKFRFFGNQERHNYNLQDFSRNCQESHLVTQEDKDIIQVGYEVAQKMNGVEEKKKPIENIERSRRSLRRKKKKSMALTRRLFNSNQMMRNY